jgi:hypothetical protein
MMGQQPKVQNKLFYTQLNLDQRIRKDHILRKINSHVNFDFIYKEVEATYGQKVCGGCRLREQCTRSSLGRSLKRHLRQDDLDIMLKQAQSPAAKRDIKTRQHLMERSFARATRYGLQRARWRRLWRVQIQEYLTASIQNLMVLMRHIKEPSAALSHRFDRSCIHNLIINLKVRVFTMSTALVCRGKRVVYSF